VKKRNAIDWQPELLKILRDPEDAIAYLNVAMADEDPSIFLIALKNVIEAQDLQIQDVAERSHLSRQNIYRILSDKGNPRLKSIKSLLNSVGFNLSISPLNKDGVHG
jgi:probable addiction module antidote protein